MTSGHIELESSTLRAVVNPDQGADLVELRHQPSGVPLLWQRDLDDVGYVPSGAPEWSSEYFYASYRGGLQEILPNGGPSYAGKAGELGFHGEAWGARWTIDREASSSNELRLATQLRRMPLRVEKSYRLSDDGTQLLISSSVTNGSNTSLPFMWGFHPAFTDPLVDGSARLIFRAREIYVHPEPFAAAQHFLPGARFSGERFSVLAGGSVARGLPFFAGEGGTADLVYALDADPSYRILNSRLGLDVLVEWDATLLPHLWIWQECHSQGGPWQGRYHIVGLEPFSSYPSLGLGAAIENGTNIVIAPGQTLSTWLSLTVHQVSTADRSVE